MKKLYETPSLVLTEEEIEAIDELWSHRAQIPLDGDDAHPIMSVRKKVWEAIGEFI